jgi:hypothetical protein
VTSPYLSPVGATWGRLAGAVLLVAAVALTGALAYACFELFSSPGSLGTFNSSTLIFGLILFVLCLMCWQAGVRLALAPAGRHRSLFSRPAWFAIGAGFIVIALLMAGAVLSVRRPTLLDLQVILSLGGFGLWCLVLAFRRQRGPPAATDP